LQCIISKSLFAKVELIRDAEIEQFLIDIVAPIAKAAELDYKNINIHIINDNKINAFVSNGQNIFINSGLIRKFKKPDALIGVIAHEIGHIKAGHLATYEENFQGSKNALILGYILGAGAIASGSYDAGSAIIIGSSHISDRIQKKYSRSQEEIADQYAIEFLDNVSYSSNGLISLLQYLQKEHQSYGDMIDQYALTHPISSNRINFIRNYHNKLAKSNNVKEKVYYDSLKFQGKMDIIRAKIAAFSEDPALLIKKNKDKNNLISKYILAIAYHRNSNHDKSIKLLTNLIENNSFLDLKYLYEIRAQFYFEHGNIKKSINDYKDAIKLMLLKDSFLARISFANAVLSLEKNDNKLLKISLKLLDQLLIIYPNNATLNQKIAAIHHKMGDKIRSDIYLAKYYFYTNNLDNAKKILKNVKESLKRELKDSEVNLKIADLEDLLED
jgi:predicted Zn-dependent protease